MSLDIDIIAKRHVSIYDCNVTYNLAGMYYKAIKDMIENKEEYKKLNPKNGWGTYEGLLEVFQDMRNVCEQNPDGIFDIR